MLPRSVMAVLAVVRWNETVPPTDETMADWLIEQFSAFANKGVFGSLWKFHHA